MGETKKGKGETEESGTRNLAPGGIPGYIKDRVRMGRLVMIVVILIVKNAWGEDHITLLHADRAVYREEEIVLEGEVKLKFRDIYLRADSLRFNLENDMLQAKGNVILEDKENRIYGEELNYNMEEEKGVMFSSHTKIKDTYYSGESIEMLGGGRFILNNCTFHTCDDLKNPHYRLKAKRVEIKIPDRLKAHSLSFEVGGIPLLYLPIYIRNLERKESGFAIKTGYNEGAGFYTKGKYRYLLKKDHHGEILCDYFQKRGLGKGIRHRYILGKSGKGELLLYHIEDKDTLSSRWIANSTYYQEITPTETCGIKIDFLSDELVKRGYDEEIIPRRKLESYVYLTQNRNRYVLRAVGYRKDEWEGNRFVKKREDLPCLTFQSKRLNIGKSPFYYRFGMELGRKWRYGERFHNDFLKCDLSISGKIPLSKLITCSPNIGVTGKLEDTPFSGTYYTELPMRVKPYPFLDIDLKHSLKGKLQERGEVTKNRLSGGFRLMPFQGLKTFIGSEYDLMEKEFLPIRCDIQIIPNRYINLHFQSFYDIEESRFSEIGILLKGHRKDLFDLGLRYSKYLAPTQSEILRWEILLNLIEELKLRLRLNGGYNLKLGRFKWCEYSLYRNLHCLELGVNFREREGLAGREPEREFGVNVGLKAF